MQIVIALVVTPEGLPVAYEVMKGNTADNTTLTGFLDKIEGLYGRSRRIWLMDRGIPTEETLKDLASRGGEYVVGTPKGRLTKLESAFAQKPWQRVRDKVKVKLLEADEVIVFVESDDRHLVFSRYTTPEADQELVLDALGWRLPLQSPPKITKDGSVEMK